MVKAKTIGEHRTATSKSPNARRMDAKVQIPMSDDVRLVETFDAVPVVNKREEIITKENSTFNYLRLARIVLNVKQKGYAPVSVALGNEEAAFYVNRGTATVTAAGKSYDMIKGDVIYIGINESITIETKDWCDLSEFKAISCSTSYPVQFIKHTDIEGTALAADLGSKRPMSVRTVYKLIDSANVQACRLLFGNTYMKHPGGVGSYPPHFHGPDGPFGYGAEAKEEIYHFRVESTIDGDMPYVLQNCSRPGEEVGIYTHIFDEQAINVTPGYHDTIAPPAIEFMFTWCLASFTEGHRDWSQVLNKPGYDNEW